MQGGAKRAGQRVRVEHGPDVPVVLFLAVWQPMPRTRGECVHSRRPCPFLQCRYHLWTEVAKRAALPNESCVLDVADRGPSTLEVIAELLGLTRERVRQIEALALMRAKSRSKSLIEVV